MPYCFARGKNPDCDSISFMSRISFLRDPGFFAACEGVIPFKAGMGISIGFLSSSTWIKDKIPILFCIDSFREQQAYPLIIRMYRLPTDQLKGLLGDALYESLSRVLASVYDGNIGPFRFLRT